LLEWKPIKYIGTISYGIYIWQGFFVRTGPNITPKIWVHDFPQNVALTLFIAIISYELLEKRILNLKKKFKLTSKEVV
jgi:peptidoglycan/LPS O-acetylase OafA/YrhL